MKSDMLQEKLKVGDIIRVINKQSFFYPGFCNRLLIVIEANLDKSSNLISNLDVCVTRDFTNSKYVSRWYEDELEKVA